jgi:hypothetical protein
MRSAKNASALQRGRRIRFSAITRGPKQPVPFHCYLRNSIRTNSERFVLWLQNRQRQHYGPQAYIPELFQRRDLPFFALQTGHWRRLVSPPKLHHDLIDAAARVGALEVRLGYTFKNRATCIEALKVSGDTFPIYHDGVIYDYKRNNRLALLGDRVLSLAVCEIWFDTEHSTKDHSLMSSETVSRAALAVNARDLGLHKSMLVPDGTNSMNKDWLAETFEAVLGAVYVDSKHNVDVVKAIIRHLRLDNHRFLKAREEAIDKGEDQATAERIPQQMTLLKPLVEDAAVKEDGATQDVQSQPSEQGTNVTDIHGGGITNIPKADPEPRSLSDGKSKKIEDLQEEYVKKLVRFTKSSDKTRAIPAIKALRTLNDLEEQGKQVDLRDIYSEIRNAVCATHLYLKKEADDQVDVARKAVARARKGKDFQKQQILLARAILKQRRIQDNAEVEDMQKVAEEQARKIARASGVALTAPEIVAHKSAKEEAQNTAEDEELRKGVEDKAQKEAEERARKEAKDKARKEAEDRARKEVEDKVAKEAEAKVRNEEEGTLQKEEEAAEQNAYRGTEVRVREEVEAEAEARKEAEAKALEEIGAVEGTRRGEAHQEKALGARTKAKEARRKERRAHKKAEWEEFHNKAEREEEALRIEVHEERVLGLHVTRDGYAAEAPAIESVSQKEARAQEPALATVSNSEQSVEELESDISKSHLDTWASASCSDKERPQMWHTRRVILEANGAESTMSFRRLPKNTSHEIDEAAPHNDEKPAALSTPGDGARISSIQEDLNRIAHPHVSAVNSWPRCSERLHRLAKRSGRRVFNMGNKFFAISSARKRESQAPRGKWSQTPALPGGDFAVATTPTSEEQHSDLIEDAEVLEQRDSDTAQFDSDGQDRPARAEDSKKPGSSLSGEHQTRQEDDTTAGSTPPPAEQAKEDEEESVSVQTAEPEATRSTIETLEDTLLQGQDKQTTPHSSDSSPLPTQQGVNASKGEREYSLSLPAPPPSDQNFESVMPIGVAPQIMDTKQEQSNEKLWHLQ